MSCRPRRLTAVLPAIRTMRAWLRATGFEAGLGDLRLLPGPNGVAGAVAGLGTDTARRRSRFGLARAIAALPGGDWHLDGALSPKTGDRSGAGSPACHLSVRPLSRRQTRQADGADQGPCRGGCRPADRHGGGRIPDPRSDQHPRARHGPGGTGAALPAIWPPRMAHSCRRSRATIFWRRISR